jgi:hypothetical protein
MPCGHNFCKGCLDKRFAEAEAAQALALGSKALADAKPARALRVRKVGGWVCVREGGWVGKWVGGREGGRVGGRVCLLLRRCAACTGEACCSLPG